MEMIIESLTTLFRRQQAPHRPPDGWSVGWMIGWMVQPHITLSAFFSAVCKWIDLKFGRDLHIDLLFQFLFFFLNSSSNSSSEIKIIYLKTSSEVLDAFCLLTTETCGGGK
jgi:hypothetical protein